MARKVKKLKCIDGCGMTLEIEKLGPKIVHVILKSPVWPDVKKPAMSIIISWRDLETLLKKAKQGEES